jgi:hypothetical protein
MNRCGRASAYFFPALAALTLLSATGCGEDEISDELYGAVDLTPFYTDGATTAPTEIRTNRGWFDGTRVELYDFGLVNHRRKRNAAGATIREPDIAYVNPIYFFFDTQGNPMFSKPSFDKRTGVFHMKGGERVLHGTPKEPDPNNPGSYYTIPYSQRVKDFLVDPVRRTSDYQRPIIDKLQNDSTYTGLWEIVEVNVKDGGYKPDAIKSWKTLKKGIDAGKMSLTRTLKVINCPVIEDKTWIVPSPMVYRQKPQPDVVVQPRVEIWYRTKQAWCFLVNGFETLGEARFDANDRNSLLDPGAFTLYRAGETDKRLDTFDVIRYAVGEGKNRVDLVEVPVGKVYSPRLTITTGNPRNNNITSRYYNDEVVSAVPRHTPADPPGYSPITWLFDITVPQDPPYAPGSFKRLSDVDPVKISARDNDTTVWTRNYPVAGVASVCKVDADCGGFGQSCNNLPDIDVATTDPTSGNLADAMIQREGGPRCDAPWVGFGEYCAPAVSRCISHVGTGDMNDSALNAMKVTAAGPSLSVHAALKTAQDNKTRIDADPMSTQAQKDMAAAAVTTAQATSDRYKNLGYPTDLSGRGYACQPNTSTGGYCYIRCDGGAGAGTVPAATTPDGMKLKAMLEVSDPRRPGAPRLEETTFGWDTRCGGLELLGYKCLPGSGRPNKQRVCVRECTTRSTEAYNKSLCEFYVKAEGLTSGMATFSGIQVPVENLSGQTCNNLAGVTACTWNPDFEPRDPNQMVKWK